MISTFGGVGNVTIWFVSDGDAGIGSNGHTIFVERSAVHDLTTVLDELLSKLFSKGVVLSERKIAGIDTLLHELVEVGVGAVKDIDTTSSDLAVDGGEFSKDDVVPHKKRILSSPVPRGVESAGFKSVESGKDAVDVEITVFATDGIQTCLESEGISLFCIVFEISSTGVLLEVTRVELNLRVDQTPTLYGTRVLFLTTTPL